MKPHRQNIRLFSANKSMWMSSVQTKGGGTIDDKSGGQLEPPPAIQPL